MSSITQYEHEERQRVRRVLEETRELPPEERLGKLRAELEASMTARELMLTESFSVFFGGSGAVDVVTEDPRFDDPSGGIWDEVGFHRAGRSTGGLYGRRMTKRGLDHARRIGRWLAEENEYVIGSMENRVSFIVGEGLVWRAVPRDRRDADRALLERTNDVLAAFREQELMDLVEQEWIRRQDRDGEAIVRLYANADGPPRLRFIDPATLDAPSTMPQGLSEESVHALVMGVLTDPQDVRSVLGIYVRPDALAEPELVRAINAFGMRVLFHAKLNVDLNEPRGWPTYWPIRRNMARAEKLLRNMSYVAALQAAIALIRKHKRGTQTEIEAFLDRHRDLTITNNVTGKDRRYTKFGPGTIIDSGPGVDYEAPISSVNAQNNLPVLEADLQASAACVNQPAFMFSGRVGGGGYAGQLVAEGPPHKNFRRLQRRNARELRAIHVAVLEHEVFWGRLDPRALELLKLDVDFPDPQVRNALQTTQRHQILFSAGVISRASWRAREGLNPDEEDRLLDQEAQRGYVDPRRGGVRGGEKPPPGSTDGGPGGADQSGDPEHPEAAPSETF